MKTHKIWLPLIVAVGMVGKQMLFPCAAYAEPASKSDNDSNYPAASANIREVKEAANGSSETNDLYKTIINHDVGTYAVVDSNREIVILRNKDATEIWSTNIIQGISSQPVVPSSMHEQKIRSLVFYKGNIAVGVGRGYAIIETKSGKLTGLESN